MYDASGVRVHLHTARASHKLEVRDVVKRSFDIERYRIAVVSSGVRAMSQAHVLCEAHLRSSVASIGILVLIKMTPYPFQSAIV